MVTEGDKGWRLAPGVWPVEGTLLAGENAIGQQVYTLVLPSGARFQVSRALFHLAVLLAGSASGDAIAQRLSELIGRPVSLGEVTRLVEQKLAAQGIAVPR